MNNPSLTTSEKSSRPVLVVDKNGYLGEKLAAKLSENLMVVLASPFISEKRNNIVHVPFVRKIPKIPDNYYSAMFLIDDGRNLSHSMESIIKKASADNTKLILIEGIRTSNEKSIDETRFYKNAKIVFYGDLFDNEKTLSIVGKFITSAKKNREIKVGKEGLYDVFPIDLDSFINILIEEIYIKQNPSKVINIFPKNAITALSLARKFQSLDPMIKIDFSKNRDEIDDAKIIGGDFVLPVSYDLKIKLKDIMGRNLPADFQAVEPLAKQVEEKRYLRTAILLLMLFMVFFLSLPLTTTIFYASLGAYEISSVKNNLEKGNIDLALRSSRNAQTFFSFSSKTLSPLRSEAEFFGQGEKVQKLSDNIQTGQSVSEATTDLISASITIRNIVEGKSQNPSSDFDASTALIKSSISEFRRIEAQKNDFGNIQEKISSVSPLVDLLSNSIDVLPDLLGFNGEKKFLILFQNNMELRPGGGFVGSYGLLTMNNGMARDFKIYNVYDADGQLKGHIEPPFPIMKYLPQPNFYLRDSNFNLTFPQNASAAAYFLNLETGEKVDGVAAVDLDFVKNLINAIGPVSVSDYSVTIDSSNLFQITEEKSQKNSFAGSTQKQDFLTSLFNNVEQKLGQDKNIPYLSLAGAISDSLSQKHILLASDDPSIEQNFTVNGWSSDIVRDVASQSGNFTDFLGINEANLGINKVNYSVSRSVSKAQMIDSSGGLSSTVTVSYKNDSKADTYRNYLRFILPDDITVSEISFDNVSQNIIAETTNPAIYESKSYKKPSGLEVDSHEENGKTVVGFLVEIPPASLKTISITYNLNYSLDLGQQINYQLDYYKQPGTDPTPFDFSLYYPDGYKVLLKENSSTLSDHKVGISKTLSSDATFDYSLTQN